MENRVNSAPQVSVIVEWENAALSGEERSALMLERLAQQIRDLGRSVEVIVVCDPSEGAVSKLESLLTQHFGHSDASPFGWHLITAPGAHYYEFKNRGAEEAHGALLVIIDSDVVPEDGWLAALLEPFEDPNVQVVAGHSYVEATGLYSRAMALGWFFPRRSEKPIRHDQGSHFFANNVAFRTEVLRAHPFLWRHNGATRGACVALASDLIRRGVPISVTTAAQVSHPPPNGLSHFLVRAVADGRDEVIQRRSSGLRMSLLPGEVFRRYATSSSRAFRSIARYRRTVNLGAAQVPFAWGIMGSYYGIALLSALVTWIAPGPMSRNFRI